LFEADVDLEEIFEFFIFKFGLNQIFKFLLLIDEIFNKLLNNIKLEDKKRNKNKDIKIFLLINMWVFVILRN
jgi:hypothetical protein